MCIEDKIFIRVFKSERGKPLHLSEELNQIQLVAVAKGLSSGGAVQFQIEGANVGSEIWATLDTATEFLEAAFVMVVPLGVERNLVVEKRLCEWSEWTTGDGQIVKVGHVLWLALP